jgi:sodium/bile acid cotransporter 7
MLAANLLPLPLADGLVICLCLPQARCLVIVLTKTAGGDEAASIFNSAFSNLVGILLSPVLILCYLGVSPHVEKAEVFLKLSLKVTLPLLLGQIVHNFVPHAKEMATNHKTRFKQFQSFAMAFIVFTTFSKL